VAEVILRYGIIGTPDFGLLVDVSQMEADVLFRRLNNFTMAA